MARLIVEPKSREDLRVLVSSAISQKLRRLEIGVKTAEQKLRHFEKKYAISTKEFLNSWASEDLKGKDNEYIEWYGEHEILQKIRTDLDALRKVQHVH